MIVTAPNFYIDIRVYYTRPNAHGYHNEQKNNNCLNATPWDVMFARYLII